MEPTLTEFSYGYCVTEEFANGMGPGLKAAPFFPSLHAEGKEGGGFDVRIGSALFLQFKLTEELTRRSARETKLGLLEPPFFRFWLHRRDRSRQHEMLIQLEEVTGNQVYYIAPCFAQLDKLDEAYTGAMVIQESALFSPAEIGPLPDDEYHSVAFRRDQGFGWFCSEPREIRRHPQKKVLSIAKELPDQLRTESLLDWLEVLANKMEMIIRESTKALLIHGEVNSRPQGRRPDPLQRVAYLARAHFGSELFLYAEPRQT